MIDFDYLSWIAGFCEHEKTRTNQALQLLRRCPYAQSFQRKTGRHLSIQEAEILLSQLREHPQGFDETWIQLAGKEAPEAEMRGVRTSAPFAGTSFGSGQHKQPAGEYSDALQELPRLLAHDGEAAWKDGSWENAIPRVSDGIPRWVDRLKSIGNGQVPAVVRLAWHTIANH